MACRLVGAKPSSKKNGGILLIGPLGTNFSEILIKIYTFSFKKMHLNMSSGKQRHFVSAQCVNRAIWDVRTLDALLALLSDTAVVFLELGSFPGYWLIDT